MKTIQTEEFREIARLHALWFKEDPIGRRMELSDVSVAGVELRGGRLMRARLARVDLGGADLKKTCLDGAELEDVSFERADLQGASIGASLVRGSFDGADMRAGSLAGSRVRETSFNRCKLDGANLSKSTFKRVTMATAVVSHCHAVRWEVRDSDLRMCDFTGSKLTSSSFERCDLRSTDFTDTELYRTLFASVKVHGAHGLPFFAEAFGRELDFSAQADCSRMGAMENLRLQLGGGPGPGSARYGLGATPSLYRAYEVSDSGLTYYAIERIADHQEVIRIVDMTVVPDTDSLAVEYELVDKRFMDWIAVDLISEVLLAQFLGHQFRDKVSYVAYRNVGTDLSQFRDYGVPQEPAKPR